MFHDDQCTRTTLASKRNANRLAHLQCDIWLSAFFALVNCAQTFDDCHSFGQASLVDDALQRIVQVQCFFALTVNHNSRRRTYFMQNVMRPRHALLRPYAFVLL
jgi:hypothetical protein